MRRAICLISLGIASLLVVPGTAAAEGGASIASAPVVTYGQQEFGNLAGGAHVTATCDLVCCESYYHQFWSLSVLAGDNLTFDWESQAPETELKLLPIGTTDYTLEQTKPVAEQTLSGNGKNELQYKVSQTGTMPLDFKSCEVTPGPYDFTVYVKHTLRLFIPRRGVLPLRGTVAVSVRNPEGHPISDPGLQVLVQIQSHGHWRNIGSTSAGGGVASVPYTVPAGLRGSHASLRAIARGNEYEPASSATVRVRLA